MPPTISKIYQDIDRTKEIPLGIYTREEKTPSSWLAFYHKGKKVGRPWVETSSLAQPTCKGETILEHILGKL